MKTFGLWINGAEVASAAGATFDVGGLQAYRAYTQTQSVVVTLTNEPFDWYGGGTRYS